MAKAAEPLIPLACACASLRRAARAVTRLYERNMKYTGLTPTQFTLLQALDLSGPTPQGRLGDALALDSATLTRTLGPLARKGIIEKTAGKDRREYRWMLTPAGRRGLARALPAWKRSQSSMRARLGNARWERLTADLAAVATEARF
ncbi:MAG TPA: MarR family winged helix-turn-helix transcriptional regulator [Gemmatimonadales bacterium]|nr:MarR family winged helix-turn-helix transcriptional regulator [Gemmatimonadales bacterium]